MEKEDYNFIGLMEKDNLFEMYAKPNEEGIYFFDYIKERRERRLKQSNLEK